MEALAKALRDTKGGFSPAETPSIEIDVMARRWEQGLDIWTGKPLTGEALHDWKRLHAGEEENDFIP
jgi:hypothetical protein